MTFVDKVAAVLDALSSSGRLGLSELARRSGVPKATTHRLLVELAAHDLVDRAADGWCLGPKLFELGQRVPSRRRLRDVALPFLEDLHTMTRHTVHLAALEHDDLIYVEKLPGRDAVTTPSEVAGRMPLHCTATGKCLLANAGPDVLGRVLGGGLTAMTVRTITEPAVLREQLADVRRNGVATERDELVDGYSSLASPIFSLAGTAIGAISVTTTSDRFDADVLARLVRQAAAKVTARFGGRPTDPT